MDSLGIETIFRWNGDAITAAERRGAAIGVTKAAIRLGDHSAEMAPIDQGDLRGSRDVTEASPTDANPTAVLVFDEPYATIQHEAEGFVHTAGAHGEPAGEDHYVSKNFTKHADEYKGIIAGEVARAIRSA